MANFFDKNVLNESFGSSVEQQVWEKGEIVAGYDEDKYRKDKCGAWMQRNLRSNGVSLSLHWEIDHKNPKNNDGQDNIENLQPLQWENNRGKEDNYPKWDRTVTADGDLKNKY